MANICYDTNLLLYSGTSQKQRALQGLLAQYAKVDERTVSQLILFAKKYGAYLNYYDVSNKISGDWTDFMSKDVSVIIAAIADWEIKDLIPFIEYVNEKVHGAADDEEAKKYFKTIFDLVFTVVSQLDSSLRRLPNDVQFIDFLSVAITSNLALPFVTLYQYYTTFRDASLSLIDENSTYVDLQIPVTPVVLSGNFDVNSLSNAWNTTLPVAPQITLQGINVKDDINHILTHNLFTGPLQLFINGIINIVSKTPVYLDETLNNYPEHEPHYGLYLVFLRLFGFAQDHLNNFTQNHLDFYYKDVLQLKNRNAVPDFVHLSFELQKNIDQYLLSKDTLFKAGKDSNNNDLFYAITDDVVLKKGSVQSLQSLYLSKGTNAALYASPVANSDNGNGAKLSSADNSWFAFGDPQKIALANIGFAVASNLLFLNEGSRIINFVFNCDSLSGITVNDLGGLFKIRFTAKKDWYSDAVYMPYIDGNTFILAVSLGGDVPAIVPYSPKIHNGNFNTQLPVAQAMISNYQTYQKIKGIKIKTLTLSVSASIKNLSLENKDGKINTAKPFKPFGDFPGKNASFIIGSKEIFQKPLTSLTIKFDWQPVDNSLFTAAGNTGGNTTSKFASLDNSSRSGIADLGAVSAVTDPNPIFQNANVISANTSNVALLNSSIAVPAVPADVLALSAGNWNPLASSTDVLVNNIISISPIPPSGIPLADIDFTQNQEYAIDTVSGFIKLQLATEDYGFPAYLLNMQKAIGQTNVIVNSDNGVIKGYTIDPPKLTLAPPQLIANTVSVDYTATAGIDFASTDSTTFLNRTSLYYHTEPFGLREMHPFLTHDAITVLPVFDLDDGQINDNGGELWIGLKDVLPEDTLSIVFQVSDGSANPLKSMTQVSWYFLSADNWLEFKPLNIIDQTNNLTRSGIVTVSLPDTATTGNNRADASLTWIKLVADHDTDAVCKLIAINANAAKATFVQNLSKGVEFTQALPANTISKPATAIAAIKKIQQPFLSFGGRLHETDEQFYVRVSERLRHKHRSVAGWDYERLVLDYFPQIHKAKCISHTGYITNQNTNEQKYSEVLPGHVTIVTIPDLTNSVSVNLLRPFTSIGLLEEIQQYLENIISPFVRLHVTNPQFEEVQFDFQVTFLPNFDINYFSSQLSDDIERFLTPWAYQNGSDIEFGGTIEKSVVLNFVEERPYVDFVTCFKMNHIISRNGNLVQEALYNIEEAVASTARSILVSYYNQDGPVPVKHIINSPANCNCDG